MCCYYLQLIQEAIDHGDTHKNTMQMVDYWLLVSVHLFAELLPIMGAAMVVMGSV